MHPIINESKTNGIRTNFDFKIKNIRQMSASVRNITKIMLNFDGYKRVKNAPAQIISPEKTRGFEIRKELLINS